MAREQNQLTAEISHDVREFQAAMRSLQDSVAKFPNIAHQIRQALFGDGDSLLPGFIEFSAVPAVRAGRITVRLHMTDRFRKLVSAAAAGDV